MRFIDVWNPTEAELREWAADPDPGNSEEMPQDWELAIAEWTHVDLITELAGDSSCPNRGFFLAVLYLMAGVCVRDRSGNSDIPHLRALLGRLEHTSSQPLGLFRARAEALLARPSTFDYSKWCGGEYARE